MLSFSVEEDLANNYLASVYATPLIWITVKPRYNVVGIIGNLLHNLETSLYWSSTFYAKYVVADRFFSAWEVSHTQKKNLNNGALRIVGTGFYIVKNVNFDEPEIQQARLSAASAKLSS